MVKTWYQKPLKDSIFHQYHTAAESSGNDKKKYGSDSQTHTQLRDQCEKREQCSPTYHIRQIVKTDSIRRSMEPSNENT